MNNETQKPPTAAEKISCEICEIGEAEFIVAARDVKYACEPCARAAKERYGL